MLYEVITLYSFLVENDDEERLSALFDRPTEGSGQHKALVQGNYNAPEEPAGTTSSSYSKPILSATEPVYLFSLSEVNFLQAEAIVRYGVADYNEAREKYNEAMRSAYWRVLQREYTAYTSEVSALIESKVNSEAYRFPAEGSATEEVVEAIMVQKWVSLAGIQSLSYNFV